MDVTFAEPALSTSPLRSPGTLALDGTRDADKTLDTASQIDMWILRLQLRATWKSVGILDRLEGTTLGIRIDPQTSLVLYHC